MEEIARVYFVTESRGQYRAYAERPGEPDYPIPVGTVGKTAPSSIEAGYLPWYVSGQSTRRYEFKTLKTAKEFVVARYEQFGRINSMDDTPEDKELEVGQQRQRDLASKKAAGEDPMDHDQVEQGKTDLDEFVEMQEGAIIVLDGVEDKCIRTISNYVGVSEELVKRIVVWIRGLVDEA